MLVVAMVENHGLAQAKQLPEVDELCLWVDVPEKRQSQASGHQYISANQANQYLGTSNQYVIYNAHRGFNASALCAH